MGSGAGLGPRLLLHSYDTDRRALQDCQNPWHLPTGIVQIFHNIVFFCFQLPGLGIVIFLSKNIIVFCEIPIMLYTCVGNGLRQ